MQVKAAEGTRVTARNVVVNLLYYTATVITAPWLMLKFEDRLGLSRLSIPVLRVSAVAVAIVAAGLQLWCIAVFQRIGKGTPSPLWPPQHLVREGPYRWLRNPMNLGELSLFVAMAMWFGSPALIVYALGAWVAFSAFVVYHEEPRLLRRFDRDYEQYRRGVRRWLPRTRSHESRRTSAAA